tara:strand:- start:835 stop:2100 length:1266 start_codon:yes stop_codon:yes gene_type:complete
MKELLDAFKKSLETKDKTILKEDLGGIVDLHPITKINTLNSPKQEWETKFEQYLAEAEKESLNPIVDIKEKTNTKEEDDKVKAESKKVDKTVENIESHNYDYSPLVDNINNVNGQELLNGVYVEIKYNPALTLEEAQSLAIKNLAKDPLHYVKEGQFGVKGLGYSEAKTQKAEGKFAASGYSEKLKDSDTKMVPVKESKEDILKKLIKESLGGVVSSGNPNSLAAQSGAVIRQMMKEQGLSESPNSLNTFMSSLSEENKEEDLPMDENEDKFAEAREEAIEASQEAAGMEEADKPDFMDIDGDGDKEESMKKAGKDKKKMKKESIDSKLAEIGKQGDIVKLEAQIGFLEEEILTKNERVNSINEDENLSELIDKGKLKDMQKEIKLLEKKNEGMKKMYEKMAGKSYQTPEVVDEVSYDQED